MSKRPGQNLHKPRTARGTFAGDPPLTAAQIAELIASATKMVIPGPLKVEWKKWSLARRAGFIAILREELKSPKDRPDKPFSSNVEPFDYGSPRAWEIANRMNAGLGSKKWKIHMRISSQGVIWEDTLWFWVPGNGYVRGQWTRGRGLPVLHHALWKRHHGRPVPPGHVISFIDGNPNNLVPENLRLLTRNELCRRNQAKTLTKRSRELTALLLKSTQKPNKSHVKTISKIRRH